MPTTTLPMPTGTVTFVLAGLAAPSVPLGDTALGHAREALGAAGGYLFETAGAVGAAFSAARPALAAAHAARQRLSGDIGGGGVAMAVHTGQAEVRDGAYRGPTLVRALHLLRAGHGGQTLVSAVARELARDDLPPGLELTDLGPYRLRDLMRPQPIFQIGRQRFEPPRTPDQAPNNLPTQASSFVGRDDLLAEGLRQLRGGHVLSLIGAEGTGKSRLALQLAAMAIDDFTDGAWWVELDRLVDPAGLPRAVASTLERPEDPSQPALAALLDWLGPRELLLVLDGMSGLADATAEFVTALRAACPHVRIIATGRWPLGIEGEVALALRPMAFPRPGYLPTAVPALTQYEAVQLFLERAAEALPGFSADNQNLPAIASVCHRLDGIPLALELAAARIPSLGEEQLASQLDDWFERRTGGRQVTLPRHQTLRYTVEWSGTHLTELDQRLLRRAAVFAGRFDAPQAVAVCAGDGLPPAAVGPALARLAQLALVATVDDEGFRLLEPVRELCLANLVDSGEDELIRDRHLAWLLARAETAFPYLASPITGSELTAMAALDAELRAALAWGLSRRPPRREAVNLTAALALYWQQRGELREGRDWLARALAAPATPDAVRARLLHGQGAIAWRLGEYASAEASIEAARALYIAEGDPVGEAWAINDLGIVALNAGQAERAEELLTTSLALKQALCPPWDVAITEANLGEVLRARGDLTGAAQCYESSLALLRSSLPDGHSPNENLQILNLGYIALRNGEADTAEQRFGEALVHNEPLGLPLDTALALAGLAGVATQRGEAERAGRLFGAAARILDATGARADRTDAADWAEYQARAEAQLGAEAWRAAWEAGWQMSTPAAIAVATTAGGTTTTGDQMLT